MRQVMDEGDDDDDDDDDEDDVLSILMSAGETQLSTWCASVHYFSETGSPLFVT